MSELTDSTLFALPQGRTVSAKLQAINSAGTSDYSDYNLSADAVLVEVVPNAPTDIRRGSLTT